MSAVFIALLIAAGSSVWAYTKLQNKTGYGNSQNAAIGAGVVFILGFIVIFTLAHTLLHN